jgi:diguanylate cyclase (GGDEF)-like protein
MHLPSKPSVVRIGTLTRVLLLVGIPLALLAVITIASAVGSSQRARDARELQSRVVTVDELVGLRRALFMERMQSVLPAWANDLGLDRSLEVTGGDSRKDLQRARDATDAALALLPPAARPFAQADLVRLRQDIDGRALTSSLMTQSFDTEDLALTTMLNARLADVQARALATGSPALSEAVTTLQDATQAFDLSSALVSDLGTLWDAAPFEQALEQSQLAATYSDFQAANDRIETTASRPVAAAWFEATRGDGQFSAAVADALKGVASPLTATHPLVDPATTLAVGVQQAEAAAGVPIVASARVRDLSGSLAAAAETSLLRASLLAALSIFASLLAALLIGRSIIAPLRRLTRQAAAIGSGALEVESLPEQGPPEFVLASRAFNELVSNLQLLDLKVNALAECDFDAAALRTPLPGRLGQSLARSVHVLSGSIVERQRLQSRLAHQATHDSLTRIPNRAAALDTLAGAAARAKRSGRPLCVAFLDLNGFKRVNDTLGHQVGDHVLRKTSKRLAQLVRGGDFVARLGGDEFVIIAEDLADDADAKALVDRVVSGLGKPLSVAGQTLSVQAAAGIVVSRGEEDKPLELLRKADFALYQAKQDEHANSRIYDEALESQLLNEADIVHGLQAALVAGGDELFLCYQPIVSSQSGRLVAVEALIRWNRPGQGIVPPVSFIPIAEQSDLIVEVDRWVLHEATRQLAQWSVLPELAGIAVSLNISGRHLLNAGLVGHVEEALADSGLAPERLMLEITETVLVSDLEPAAAQLDALRGLGVRIAIDDFGTGYSSIAHLRGLPIDEIKIDRSLIAEIASPNNRSLLQLVGDIAQNLGAQTVAEGVEREDQLAVVRDLDCTAVQGFYFSKPLLPDALLAWATEQNDSQAVRQTAPRQTA